MDEEIRLVSKGIALDEIDLAMMTFGTCAGGAQSLAMRYFFPAHDSDKPILEREFAKTAMILGPIATAYGILSLLNVIENQNRYVATFSLGYGLNLLIDLTLAGVTNYLANSESPSYPQSASRPLPKTSQ